MNRFFANIYIAYENLMVNVDQQHYLQRLKQKKQPILTAMIWWYLCVNIVEVEKQ